jgi:hypothetical protein
VENSRVVHVTRGLALVLNGNVGENVILGTVESEKYIIFFYEEWLRSMVEKNG